MEDGKCTKKQRAGDYEDSHNVCRADLGVAGEEDAEEVKRGRLREMIGVLEGFGRKEVVMHVIEPHTNHGFHKRFKHIEVRYYYIRELYRKGHRF